MPSGRNDSFLHSGRRGGRWIPARVAAVQLVIIPVQVSDADCADSHPARPVISPDSTRNQS